MIFIVSAVQTIFTFAVAYFKKDKKPAEAVKIIEAEAKL